MRAGWVTLGVVLGGVEGVGGAVLVHGPYRLGGSRRRDGSLATMLQPLFCVEGTDTNYSGYICWMRFLGINCV